MSNEKSSNMKISEVKGRPMLHWVGKKPVAEVKSFPAQLIDCFNIKKPHKAPVFELLKKNWTNLLFHGDNKEVLSTLLLNGFRGKVNLIYIDPPFDSGANYVRSVELRGSKDKVEGEEQSVSEQIQYTDIWANDNYLQFMYERLILLKELLSVDGSIYLHTDWHKAHHLRCLMDEVFGDGGESGNGPGFKGELVWCYKTRQFSKQYWNRKHQCILFYTKSDKWTFNWECVLNEYSAATIKKYKHKDENGKYRLSGRGIKGSPIRSAKDVDPQWEIDHPELVVRDYLKGGYPPEDWMIIDIENQASKNRQNFDYPTMKPSELIKRIVRASSNEGDIVLDCFSGSGTTLAEAQKNGRKWIGCDINKGAIQVTIKRLQNIIKGQLKKGGFEFGLHPCFTHYRVNDYDLQIQHNEFKELVTEHLGISSLKTESFFDGLLGKELIKIIPFNHPLTMLDLQLIKDELKKRKDEERNIVLVSLGKELRVDEDLEKYNKMKPINIIRTIELRTDKKFGSFFTHKPAQAKIEISKKKGKGFVKILDFISPTIIQRLNIDANLLQTKIKDFRSQIDVVLIDTNYKDEIFNIVIADIPERKKDFVSGEYEFDLPDSKAKIAVKIIDMLGEEVLIVK